jgi:ribosomal protein S18 acetylase RimI-like enzyme
VQRAGKFACLVATAARSPAHGQGDRAQLGALVEALVGWFFPASMQENLGQRYASAGVMGAIVVDTLGDHVPPRRVDVRGVVRQQRRKGIAYLSNLAVAPEARRRGVGLELVRRAEGAARAWGCRAAALHVDPGNSPAVALYEAAGYRAAARQPECQRWLEGRDAALVLMVRVLPRRRA